ncbi:MAG: tetratricopeptide repeat protein [Bacteroidetes bacterium]|nr:tetratricopeptide repeat protein [Bacteroidota bacterium]
MKFKKNIWLILTLSLIQSGVCAQFRSDYSRYGRIELQKEDFTQAIRYFNQALRINSNDHYAYYLRGVAKFNLDDIVGAEMDYTIAINLLPYYAEFFHNRANTRSMQLKHESAFEDYARAIELDSTDASIFFNRARTFMHLKRYDEAIKDCDKAISLNYNHEGIYILRGSAKAGGKYYEDALKDMNLVLNYNPGYMLGFIQRGKVFTELNRMDSAMMDFNYVLAADSNNTYALFSRAAAEMKSENYPEAITDLDHIIRLSPYNSYAYFNKAIILINTDKKHAALKELDNVVKINPKHITSVFYRGKIKADLKDYQGALAEYDKCIEIYPSFSNAYYEKSVVKNKLGLVDEAKEEYDKAMALGNLEDLEAENLTQEKIAYMNSLVQLSGDFIDAEEESNRVQYQFFDINMLPIFVINSDSDKRSANGIYDAFQKDNYYEAVINLSNEPIQQDIQLISSKIETLNESITSSPNNAPTYLNRALSYSSIQNFNEAFHDYDKALQIDSKYILAYFGRANSNYQLTQLIKSIGYQQQAITIKQKAAKETTPSETIQTAEYYSKAVDDYNKVLKLDPGFSYAYYNRGYVKCVIGEYQRSIDDFSYAIREKPDFSEAYYNRGLILIYLNENKLGCSDLSKAGELGIQNAYSVMKRHCHK